MEPQLRSPVRGKSGFDLRLVTLCGSVKPLFSGTDDFHDILVSTLRQKHIDARPLNLTRWGLSAVPELLRQVASIDPDAILMQYPTDAFGSALGPHVFSMLQRIAPLIITLHEFAAANLMRRASLCLLLARTTAVVATTARGKASLLSWYPWLEPRTCVIPIAANIPERVWQPSPQPIVAYFGQIRPKKGIEEYIACCDELVTRFPGTQFIIAGSHVAKFASYSKAIEREIRRRDIQFLKELLPDQVSDVLRTATVALLPFPSGASFERGTLLAAAVCGVPIVTLRGPDTPSDLASLLAPANSRDELVAQVADCLSGTAVRDAAHNRSCRLATLVSWDTISGGYAGLLYRLLKLQPVP
jgi:glycosyltransferase involved in cell wall biosynthesis